MSLTLKGLKYDDFKKAGFRRDDRFMGEVAALVFQGEQYYIPEERILVKYEKGDWKTITREERPKIAEAIALRIEKELGNPKNLSDSKKAELAQYKAYLVNYFRKARYFNAAFQILVSLDEIRKPLSEWFPEYMVRAGNKVLFFDPSSHSIEWDEMHPTYLLRKSLGCDLDFDAKCPNIEKFLFQVSEGNVDKIAYLKKLIGLIILGDRSLQEFYIILGPSDSGKSVLVSLLFSLLKGFAVSVPFGAFELSRNEGVPADIALLEGHLVGFASESQPDSYFNTQRLKTLTSSEEVVARKYHGNWYSFTNRALLLFATNHISRINDDSDAMITRMRVIQFNKSFTGEANPNLLVELREELSGLLNLALEGIQSFWDEGLEPYDEMKEFLADIRTHTNPSDSFIEENLVKNNGCEIKASDLYSLFKSWCINLGIRPVSQKRFGERMNMRYPGHHVKKSIYYYVNIEYSGYDYLNFEEF